MGIGFKELVIILIIVLVLFGAKRLRGIGTDLGAAIKGFRSATKEGEDDIDAGAKPDAVANNEGRVIEGEATAKHSEKARS